MNQPRAKEPANSSGSQNKNDNAQNQQEQFSRVEMVNFSRGGMCFETGHEVNSGARIKIIKLASAVEIPHHQDGIGCLAEVKWCKSVSRKESFFYRVGVEYVEPVDPKQCLDWRYGDKIRITPPLTMES